MTDDFDIEIQISHQTANHLQLLIVFLAKNRRMGPNNIEELRNHRGHSPKVAALDGRRTGAALSLSTFTWVWQPSG